MKIVVLAFAVLAATLALTPISAIARSYAADGSARLATIHGVYADINDASGSGPADLLPTDGTYAGGHWHPGRGIGTSCGSMEPARNSQ
jgi:hypothetical protein